MTSLQQKLLAAMETNLPIESRPFLRLAERLGVKEKDLLEAIRAGLRRGLIRRYGARVSHRRAGFSANVMTVWQVTAEKVEAVAGIMAAHPAVSHCYERPTFAEFPYNLYAMIHGHSRKECETVIAEIAARSQIRYYRALWTTQEFKKTAPSYSQLIADAKSTDETG
jgi:DNA-binding Lrp family transcriptional regulator